MSIAEIEILISNLNELISLKRKEILKECVSPEIILDISRYHRSLACAVFLARYDINQFSDLLFKSAKIYQFMLDNKHVEMDRYYLSKSKGLPLFDAIAVDELGLARDISHKMTPVWSENMECEDDFIYFDIISELIEEEPDITILNNKIEKYEEILDGFESIRYDLLKAIVKSDAEEFKVAFDDLLEEREDEIDAMSENNYICLKTEANIFIEGIALLRIAKRFGINVDENYYHIPQVLLEKPEISFDYNFCLW